MGEDEAFIRAIIDGPGDDLPRLVYADWLDDRGDPRGPYLRAECEAVETGGVARLGELAAGLDPVWIARVSRPPVGVCCEHVRFTHCGPLLSRVDVDAVERKLGVELPDAYRAFLLNYNAGLLTPLGVAPPDRPSECDPVLAFHALRHSYRTAFETISDLEPVASWRMEAGLLAVAHAASDLSDVFIGVTKLTWGKVYRDCAVKPELAFQNHLPHAAASLPTYLAGLTAKWALARRGQYDI